MSNQIKELVEEWIAVQTQIEQKRTEIIALEARLRRVEGSLPVCRLPEQSYLPISEGRIALIYCDVDDGGISIDLINEAKEI